MGMGLATPEVVKPELEVMDKAYQDLHQRLKLLLLELRTHSPFFGTLASELWLAGPTKSVPTIAVDPKGSVVYNPDFMLGLTPGQQIACLLHESLHVALDFWPRFKGLRLRLANIAHDYAINDIIKTSCSTLSFTKRDGKTVKLGIELPEGVLWDAKYKNHSAEEIYAQKWKEIIANSERLKQEYMEAMSDPVKKAEWERRKAIQKALRESLAAGYEKIDSAHKSAKNKISDASDVVKEQNKQIDDILSDLGDISWKDNPADPSASVETPDAETPAQGQEQAQEPGQPQDPKNDAPSEDEQNQKTPHQEAKENLKKGIEKAMHDYMAKEEKRITDEYDNIPTDATREKHLEELKEDLKEVAENYVDKVTKSRENGIEDPQANDPSADDKKDGEQPSQKASGQGQEQNGDEPGNDPGGAPDDQRAPGGAPTPGENGKSDPNGQPTPAEGGAPGEGGAPDKDGAPSTGKSGNPSDMPGGEPGEGFGNGQGASSGGQSMPGQDSGGSSSVSSEPSFNGEGVPGQGDPSSGTGKEGPEDSPYDPDMPYNGDPLSERQARQDVEEAMGSSVNEMTKSLTGQDGGMKGIDRNMASGNDDMSEKSLEQAFEDAINEYKNILEGDINIDCDHLPGNPFKAETPEQTAERKRQTLNRAIQEDLQAGGQGQASLPAWFKSEIEGILHPPLSFTARMRRFMGRYGREIKRTYSKANKRNTFFENHIIRPGLIKNQAKMYIIQDVSGSMMSGKDLDSLRRSMGLIERCAVDQNMEIVVVQCDTGVTSRMNTREAMAQINKRQFTIHGQGGSDLRPAFDLVWKEMQLERAPKGNLVCVFTDGAITVPERPPLGMPQEVLWITLQHQNPPTDKWGKHVVMDNV